LLHCLNVSQALSQCKKLARLSLARCQQITDGGIEPLARDLPCLIALDVNHCPFISDASLELIATHVKGLIELNISFCVAVTTKGIQALARSTPTLQKLKLAGCGRVDDDGINALSSRFTRLEELDISFLHKVTGPVVRAALHNLLELHHLNLNDLHLLTDETFLYDELDGRPGAQRLMLAKLRTLKVSNCSRLTSKAVQYLAQRATELEDLDLSGCDDLDDNAAEFLTLDASRGARRNESLSRLNLNFCGKLTDRTLRCLADRLPDLQVCMNGLGSGVGNTRWQRYLTSAHSCRSSACVAAPI